MAVVLSESASFRPDPGKLLVDCGAAGGTKLITVLNALMIGRYDGEMPIPERADSLVFRGLVSLPVRFN
jgi:hypothetical protein